MPTVEQFKKSLASADVEAVVDQWLLAPGAQHVMQPDIDHIRDRLAACYGISAEAIQVWITGSAKLGFSISEKPKRDAPSLPRYRKFGRDSDVDVAVVSRDIFELVWRELSLHSHGQPRFPWDAGKLADYLLCGWLRPDHFPRHVRLYRCDSWWDTFRQLSAEPRFGRRRVRGGLFHSIDQLRSYMSRAVNECIADEELASRGASSYISVEEPL